MRQWNRNVLMFVMAGAMAFSPLVGFGQHAPAAPEPPEPPQDPQIVIDRAEIERAVQQAQAAGADARMALLQAGVDADGKAKLGYWVQRGGKKEKAAFLGVTASVADGALRNQLKLPRGIGVVIQSVGDESPAAAAGIQEHDVYTKLDDQWLVGQNQLGILIRMHKPGEEITLTGVREGSPITIKAKLGEKEMLISDNDGTVIADAVGGNFQLAVPDMQMQFERLAPIMADGEDANLIIRENDQTLKVSVKDGTRHLVATDNNNQVLFDGPCETEDQRKVLPADIAEMLAKYKEQFDKAKEAGPGNKVRIIKDNR